MYGFLCVGLTQRQQRQWQKIHRLDESQTVVQRCNGATVQRVQLYHSTHVVTPIDRLLVLLFLLFSSVSSVSSIIRLDQSCS